MGTLSFMYFATISNTKQLAKQTFKDCMANKNRAAYFHPLPRFRYIFTTAFS